MKPTYPPKTTRVLGPSGWDASCGSPCGSLCIMDVGGVMYSFWKPSLREKILILLGRSVKLGVVGDPHPSVSLGIDE